MIRRVIGATKRVLGLRPPGRALTVFPDDTFLVSYPKSGNTWARFLIANLVWPDRGVDFANLNWVIPVPDVTPRRDLLRIPQPRIVKSHEYFDPRYPRIIYIVRDPRDVVLSQYHAHRKKRSIDDQYPIEAFVRRFLAGETCDYCAWGEHVASWLSTRNGQPRFLLLRYEDMLQDTSRELSRVATFLGINPTEQQIQRAISRSSADKMRKLERAQAQLFNATKGTRQDILFVRAAKAGGWHSALPENCSLQIEEAWGHLMRYLGYELSATGKAKVAEAAFSTKLIRVPYPLTQVSDGIAFTRE